MTTASPELSIAREDLIRQLFGDDIDFSFIEKVSSYVQKLRKKKEKEEDYYKSEQFYKDLDEAEEQIRRGECIKINTDEELRKLIYG